jgi:hypothetical protein
VLHPIVHEGKPIGAIYIRSDSQLLENRLKRYAQTGAGADPSQRDRHLLMGASC